MKWLDKLNMGDRGASPESNAVSPLDPDSDMTLHDKTNHLCIYLFKEHHSFLLGAKTSQIVESVWGYKDNGPLSKEQQQISEQVAKVVEDASIILQPQCSSREACFTLRSILHNLIMFKLMYMLERHRSSVSARHNLSMN